MKFHPDKSKVVTIKHRPSPLAMIPFVAYHYHQAENLLSYADKNTENIFKYLLFLSVNVNRLLILIGDEFFMLP